MDEILIIASLLAHGFLLSRSLRFGVYFIILILPLYVVRTHIGPIPTTLLEPNILLLFGWWIVRQITNYSPRFAGEAGKLQITNKTRVPNSQRFENLNFGHWNLFGIWNLEFGICRRLRSALGFWFWLILVWLAVATLSMLISPNLREAAGAWKAYFVEPILFLVVFVDVMSRPTNVETQNFVSLPIRNMKTVFNTLIASGTAVAIIAIIQKFTGWWIENPFWQAETTRRVTSVFPFPNAVGLFLAPIAITTLAIATSYLPKLSTLFNKKIRQSTVNSPLRLDRTRLDSKANPRRIEASQQSTKNRNSILFIVYCLLFIVMLFAILFARSRGALLGVGAGVLFLALFHKCRRVWYWMGIAVIALIMLLAPLKHGFLNSLLSNPASFSGGDSNAIRIETWKESLKYLEDHPVLGAGLSGYQRAIEPYHSNPAVEIYKFPHNILLNFWMELGLAGLAVFLLIIFQFYRTLLRSKALIQKTVNKKQLTDKDPYSCLLFTVYCLLASMTALLVHGIIDVPYFKNDLSVLFWIFIGISCILNSLREAYDIGSIPQKKLSI